VDNLVHILQLNNNKYKRTYVTELYYIPLVYYINIKRTIYSWFNLILKENETKFNLSVTKVIHKDWLTRPKKTNIHF